MGGKIKNRSTRHREHGPIYRPAAGGWQQWESSEDGSRSLAGTAMELEDLNPTTGGLIAVPVRRAFSLAFWLPMDDPTLLDDLVFTQLELRGLAGRSRQATTFARQEIAREENEALLQVVVLPSNLAPRYWHGDVTEYTVSPLCLPLEADAVTLWMEEGIWTAAVTRGTTLLHFQALTSPEPDASMALEIWMMLAPLEAGRMVNSDLVCLVYYEGETAPELESWRSSQGMTIEARPLPSPIRPAKSLECMPLPVQQVQAAKVAGSRRQRLVLVAAAIYFLLVLTLAVNTLRLHWKAGDLQANLESKAPAVAVTKETMQRWNALNAAIDPLGYPLEILYQTARLLPKDGVRLTLFEMTLGRVVIQGEASTFPAAQRFQDEVKKNPDLAIYEWTAENPRSLPKGSARFQIDGTLRGFNSSEERGSIDAGADI